MVDGAVLPVAVVLWCAAAYQSLSVRRQPFNHAVRALRLTFVFLAAAATLFIPDVHLGAGRILHLPNITEPAARTAVLAAAWSAQSLLLHLTRPTPAATAATRRRALVVLPTIAAVLVLFIAAPVGVPTTRFTRDYGGDPWVVAYLLVFMSYLAYALVDVMRGALRYAPEAGGPLGVGLRLVAAGCVAGLGYTATKTAFLVATAVGRPWEPEVESGLARFLAMLGGLLVVLGSFLPALWPRLAALPAWLRAYWHHRQLYVLWAALNQVSPDIALDPPGSHLRDAIRLRRMQFRLYRRVIEILDGLLALRPMLDEEVAKRARVEAQRRNLSDAEADAFVEAATVQAAMFAHRSASAPYRGSRRLAAGAGVDAEVRWLLMVARYLRGMRVEPCSTAATPGVARSEAL